MMVAVMPHSAADIPVRTRLRDDSEVTLRRLEASDGPALEAALERADPMDLRRRFMGMAPPVSVILGRLRRADGVHDYALGAFTDAGRLVAVAQFDRADDAPTAEFAIEVARDFQRRGLGRQMLERLATVARALGVTRFTATYYADNIPVRRLLNDSGHVVAAGFDQGEGYAVLDLTA